MHQTELQVENGGKLAHTLLDEQLASDGEKADHATKRLKQLERTKQRLLEAYLSEAMAAEDLKPRQEAVSREIAEQRARQAQHGKDSARLHSRLDELIQVAHKAAELYKRAPGDAKQHLLRAIFAEIRVELDDEFGQPAQKCTGIETVTSGEGVLTSQMQSVLGAVGKPAATSVGGEKKNPGKVSFTGVSNVIQLAGRTWREATKPALQAHREDVPAAVPQERVGHDVSAVRSPGECRGCAGGDE